MKLERDLGPVRARVLHGVGERRLRDAQQGHLVRRRQRRPGCRSRRTAPPRPGAAAHSRSSAPASEPRSRSGGVSAFTKRRASARLSCAALAGLLDVVAGRGAGRAARVRRRAAAAGCEERPWARVSWISRARRSRSASVPAVRSASASSARVATSSSISSRRRSLSRYSALVAEHGRHRDRRAEQRAYERARRDRLPVQHELAMAAPAVTSTAGSAQRGGSRCSSRKYSGKATHSASAERTSSASQAAPSAPSHTAARPNARGRTDGSAPDRVHRAPCRTAAATTAAARAARRRHRAPAQRPARADRRAAGADTGAAGRRRGCGGDGGIHGPPSVRAGPGAPRSTESLMCRLASFRCARRSHAGARCGGALRRRKGWSHVRRMERPPVRQGPVRPDGYGRGAHHPAGGAAVRADRRPGQGQHISAVSALPADQLAFAAPPSGQSASFTDSRCHRAAAGGSWAAGPGGARGRAARHLHAEREGGRAHAPRCPAFAVPPGSALAPAAVRAGSGRSSPAARPTTWPRRPGDTVDAGRPAS